MSKPKDLKKYIFDFEALDECPLCSSKSFIPAGKIQWLSNEFCFVLCPVCSLKYMNPRPTQASYNTFYKEYFWQQKIRNIGFKQPGQIWQGIYKKDKFHNEKEWKSKEGIQRLKTRHLELRTNNIISILSRHIKLNEKTKILEIGCAFGATLQTISKQFGCKVHGIEPSLEARQSIEKEAIIKLLGYFAQNLERISKQESKFDAIIFSHVLENTTNPLEILNYAKQCLKEKGVLYIETPNLLLFDAVNPYHPFIFSRHSLSLMLKKVGFKPEIVSENLDRMLRIVGRT